MQQNKESPRGAGPFKIMGKETFMKVCNENIEQAITEKD
jgi:hypothetical protein